MDAKCSVIGGVTMPKILAGRPLSFLEAFPFVSLIPCCSSLQGTAVTLCLDPTLESVTVTHHLGAFGGPFAKKKPGRRAAKNCSQVDPCFCLLFLGSICPFAPFSRRCHLLTSFPCRCTGLGAGSLAIVGLYTQNFRPLLCRIFWYAVSFPFLACNTCSLAVLPFPLHRCRRTPAVWLE